MIWNAPSSLPQLVETEPELELLAPVPLSAVCFRYIPQPSMTQRFSATRRAEPANSPSVQRRGRVYLSNATIHGKFALRACIVNHRTTPADIEAVVNEVLKVGRDFRSEDPILECPRSQSLLHYRRVDQIFTQAPCRADLAGSTLDLWPLYLFHPGAVTVNMAVNILTSCKITPRKGRAIHLKSLDTGREDRFRESRRADSGKEVQTCTRCVPGSVLPTEAGIPAGVAFRVASGRRHFGFLGDDDLHQRCVGAICRARNQYRATSGDSAERRSAADPRSYRLPGLLSGNVRRRQRYPSGSRRHSLRAASRSRPMR